MQAYWSGPAFSIQLIPSDVFTTTNAATATSGLSARSTAPRQTAAILTYRDIVSKQAYPDPFEESLVIRLKNSSASNKISVDMFDVSGRLLYHHYFGSVAAGNALLQVDAGKKAILKGVYFLRANINGKGSSKMKVVKRKQETRCTLRF